MCCAGCCPTWKARRRKTRRINRHRAHLGRRKPAADRPHLAERIIVPLARAPCGKLGLEIGGGLASERRVRRIAFAVRAVTACAGHKIARGITAKIETRAFRIGFCGIVRRRGAGGIIGRDLRAVGVGQFERDRAHQRMVAPPVGIIVELAVEITGVEPGEARAGAPVAFAAQTMTGETCGFGAGVAAAERQRLAGGAKAVVMGRRVASHQREEEKKGSGAHLAGTIVGVRWFPKHGARGCRMIWKGGFAGSMLLMLTACNPAPVEAPLADASAIARGKSAAERLGCGACHDIPGIDWPKGNVGPPLAAFGKRRLIAGRLPNDLPLLAAFIRDAPATVPGSAMPAMPIAGREAQDIAAWLQSLRD
jgi:hypothetical protein